MQNLCLSDFSVWGVILLVLLAGMAIALYWLADRRILQRMLRVFGLAVAQMALVGLYIWAVWQLDRWWADVLWLVAMGMAVVALAVRQAGLPWQQWLLPVAAAVTVSCGVVTGVLLLAMPGRLFVPVVGVLMAQLLTSMTQALRTYTSSLRHTEEHRLFLMANGATKTEAMMPTVRRTLRGALLPLLKQLFSPLVVAMPLLFCGLLMGGATIAAALASTLMLWAAAFVAIVLAAVVFIWGTTAISNSHRKTLITQL